MAQGPLKELRIVEFAGIGPAPFGVMLLADLGADVLRIERSGAPWPDVPIVSRGRASMTLDLKSTEGRAMAIQIIDAADVVVEGFRPGVMERMGLGPEDVLARNPALVYARMTGWGQNGPLANSAGHDVNYIGLTGMLDMIGTRGAPPRAPQNFLGDYGAGGTYLALGILAALYERQRSGKGQVVDAAIVDGSVSMLAPLMGMVAAGLLPSDPAEGMLAGDASCYRTYACSDGRFLAVGSLEPQFQTILADRLGLPDLSDISALEALFATRSRDEWVALFEGVDCCVSPVLDIDEAKHHPHLLARGVFVDENEMVQPAPAPRFSRTPGAVPATGEAAVLLKDWGVKERES